MKRITLVCLILSYGFFLSHKLDISRADIGRMLKSGEIFLANHQPQATNLFSYTHPDYPAPNHYFGTGIFYYLLYRAAGFAGLALFKLLISLISFFLFLRLAGKRSSWPLCYLMALPVILLLAYRFEIRPEEFSYLLTALFLIILYRFSAGGSRGHGIFLLPFLEVLWVNLHSYFFLGPLLVLSFVLETAYVNKLPLAKLKKLWLVFGAVILATLVNPFGLKGTLVPLGIARNFNYPISEVQPLWFYLQAADTPVFGLLAFMIMATVLSFLLVFLLCREKFAPALFLMTMFFAALAGVAIRNIAFFAYFSCISLSWNLTALGDGSAQPKVLQEVGNNFPRLFLRPAAAIAALAFLILALTNRWSSFIPYSQYLGWGAVPGNDRAARFLKEKLIRGPLMNNLDIGSYLIFYLYPKERVFVDNRPEAYPAEFFDQVYIPMLMDDQKWQQQDKKFNFNAIVFSLQDISFWGQHFMRQRILDPDWAPVFVDPFVLIFLRRSGLNQQLIQRYEIPRQAFSFE